MVAGAAAASRALADAVKPSSASRRVMESPMGVVIYSRWPDAAETRRETVLAAEVEVQCVLLQRAGGGVTVNEAMFVLSTKVAPVSMKTGTGERVPRDVLASRRGLSWWNPSSTRVPKYAMV